MHDLVTSFIRAIGSLFAPGMLGVMVLCVLTTILMLFGFAGLMSVLFATLSESALLAWIGSIGSFFLAWFLFPGIMPVTVSFFSSRISDTIEKADYPALGKPAMQNFLSEFWYDTRFSIVTVLCNIFVLPLYLIPVVNLFLFYLLNGYLLGRGFFIMAARRHLSVPNAEELRRKNSRAVFIGGVVFTIIATIPIANLFAPFWGIAVMTHLYHRFSGTPEVIKP